MTIIGYTYNADWHCPACAKQMFFRADAPAYIDKNFVPYSTKDNDGNPIHPVFSTDDTDGLQHCGDCAAPLQ